MPRVRRPTNHGARKSKNAGSGVGIDVSEIGKPLVSKEDVKDVINEFGLPSGTTHIDFKTYLRLKKEIRASVPPTVASYRSLLRDPTRSRTHVRPCARNRGRGGNSTTKNSKGKSAGKNRKDRTPVLLEPSNMSRRLLWGMIKNSRKVSVKRDGPESLVTRRAYKRNKSIHRFGVGCGNLTGAVNPKNSFLCPVKPGRLRADVSQVRVGSGCKWTKKHETRVRLIGPNADCLRKSLSACVFTFTPESRFPTKDLGLIPQLMLARSLQKTYPNNPEYFKVILHKVMRMNRRALRAEGDSVAEESEIMEVGEGAK